MRILIDADGCPVVDITIAEAKKRKIDCLLLCDTSHVFEKPGAQTLTFSKGADSVDFALVNMLQSGDLVITQDYGLAAMCLARGAGVLNQNGMAYTAHRCTPDGAPHIEKDTKCRRPAERPVQTHGSARRRVSGQTHRFFINGGRQMIVYFSGTGNSRYCAEMLAAKLGDELLDAFHFIRDGIAAELSSARPWVFVSPTYAWQLPRVFADFLRSGSFTGCKTAYFVMTCGSEIGNAGAKIGTLCTEKGLDSMGVLEVVMPENYVAMFAVPDKAEAAEMVAAAKPVLEAGIDAIREGKPFPERKPGAADRLKTTVINPLFYAFAIRAKQFYVTDACTGCGKCECSCVLNNVHLKDGKPIWGNRCTHCMACICGCPAEAVEYGGASRGKPHYQCADYQE